MTFPARFGLRREAQRHAAIRGKAPSPLRFAGAFQDANGEVVTIKYETKTL
jgi:hypothetical protein